MKEKFAILLIIITITFKSFAQLPTGFASETYHNNSTPIVGMTFDQIGRIFFWEKSGKVWMLNNKVKGTTPLLDISAQVRDNYDLGLIGFVLDPDFMSNGYIYVCYPLKASLIPGHNPSEPATYARVSRFTVNNPNNNYPVASLASENILIGETHSTGIPIIYEGHMGGSLSFGDDGSLIVTTGDGAFFDNDDNGSRAGSYFTAALNQNIIGNDQNIGSNRSQYDNSLNGKALRIDPTTGDGLPSNPYYNSSFPRSPLSRQWAKGLRNPWKIVHVPNSGNHINPGKFLIGDVGSIYQDELNLLEDGGQNFGWPGYEGMNSWVGGRPSSSYPSSWIKPKLDMRLNVGRGYINGNIYQAGSPQLPGNNIFNNYCIVLGDFYSQNTFPAQYQNSFFFGDYAGKNIYYTKFDSNWNPTTFDRFANVGDNIFAIASSPTEEGIFYVSSNSQYGGNGQIRRIFFDPSNQIPVAKIKADTLSGGKRLTVGFNADFSYDPDPSNVLTYSWSFTDGQVATGLKPHVTFETNLNTEVIIKATLTVTDNFGAFSKDSLNVHLNNLAPKINSILSSPTITSLTPNLATPITLTANVEDDQGTASLTYEWSVFEVHNGHEHLENTYTGNNVSINLPATFCSQPHASYWAKVLLEVTDPSGLNSSSTLIFSPNCGGQVQALTFNPIPDQVIGTGTVNLIGSSSSGLTPQYFGITGPAGVLGSNLFLFGLPGRVTIRGTQHGNTIYNPAKFEERSFNVVKSRTAQTINFTPIGTQVTTATPLTLTATSSLGLPVKFVIISGPASVAGNQLSLNGMGGKVRIRAFVAGDNSINGVYVDQEFNVCPINYTLTSPNNDISQNAFVLFSAQNSISSSAKITSTSNVEYGAGNHIVLTPGFLAENGTVFKAEINACQN